MDDQKPDFPRQLAEALATRAAWLEAAHLAPLGQALRTYRSLFESMAEALSRKGLLREDPYEKEQPPDLISPPSDAAIADSEEAAQMATRMTAYRRRLERIAESLPLDLPSLGLGALRRLSAFFAYLDWASFSDLSRSPTTRVLSRLVQQTSVGGDPLAAKVMQETRAQLKKAAEEIRARLALVEAWQRESWKARARAAAPALGTDPGYRDGAVRAAELDSIKAACRAASPPLKWHPDLIQEVLAEERGEEAAARRERLLAALAVPAPQAPTAPAMDPAEKLREAARSLSTLGAELCTAEEVLTENEAAIQKSGRGLLQRLRDWLRRFLGGTDERSYEIETRESPEEPPERESIPFLGFQAQLLEAADGLRHLGAVESEASQRVRGMSREALADFLDWQVRELRLLRRRVEGLNAHFQLRAVQAGVAVARGVRLELLAMENAIARVEAARAESVIAAVSVPPAPEVEPEVDNLG
jgi:hypothetical protein